MFGAAASPAAWSFPPSPLSAVTCSVRVAVHPADISLRPRPSNLAGRHSDRPEVRFLALLTQLRASPSRQSGLPRRSSSFSILPPVQQERRSVHGQPAVRAMEHGAANRCWQVRACDLTVTNSLCCLRDPGQSHCSCCAQGGVDSADSCLQRSRFVTPPKSDAPFFQHCYTCFGSSSMCSASSLPQTSWSSVQVPSSRATLS